MKDDGLPLYSFEVKHYLVKASLRRCFDVAPRCPCVPQEDRD